MFLVRPLSHRLASGEDEMNGWDTVELLNCFPLGGDRLSKWTLDSTLSMRLVRLGDRDIQSAKVATAHGRTSERGPTDGPSGRSAG